MSDILKISGAINIIISMFYLIAGKGLEGPSFVSFVFLLVCGLVFIKYSELEDLREKKNIILVLSLLCLPKSFVSGLINIVNINKIESEKQERAPNINGLNLEDKKVSSVEPETKRLDILIKIGVMLITLAGIIFVVSDWNSFAGYSVLIFLCLLLGLFYTLYKLFTIKVKLPSSSKLYFILCNVLVLLIYLVLGYYKLLGEWFSVFGSGKYLYYSVLFLIASLLTYNLKKITKSNFILYCSLTLSLISLYVLLYKFVKLDYAFTLLIIELIFILTKLTTKNNHISSYCEILIQLLIVLSGKCLYEDFSIYSICLIFINLIIANVLNLKSKTVVYDIMTPIVNVVYPSLLIYLGFNKYGDISLDITLLFIILILNLIYILCLYIKLFNYRKVYDYVFSFIFNFVLAICCISIYEHTFLPFIIITRILLLFVYFIYAYQFKLKDIEKYFVPVNIVQLFCFVFVHLKTDLGINIDINIWIIFVIGILSLLYYMVKENKFRKLTFVIIWIMNIFGLFYAFQNQNIYSIIFVMLSMFVPLIFSFSNDIEIKKDIPLCYGLFGIHCLMYNSVFEQNWAVVINLIIYYVIFMILFNKPKYNRYVLLFVGLPLIKLHDILNSIISYDLNSFLLHLTFMYILFIFIIKFINDKNSKKIVFMIFSSFIFMPIFFKENYLFGIYIGIVSLIMILYGVINDKRIFNYGLILLFINLLYRFRDMLLKIPMWTYLLFAGLSIIIFVTIKELKKINNSGFDDKE